MSDVYTRILSQTSYSPAPDDWVKISTIDMHTGGEAPTRSCGRISGNKG